MATTDTDDRGRRKEVYNRALGVVTHQTGGPEHPQPAMIARPRVRQQMSSFGFSASESKTAIAAAVENGDLLDWNGQLCRVDEPSLLAVIESEQAAEVTRRPLIARCNKALAEVRDR